MESVPSLPSGYQIHYKGNLSFLYYFTHSVFSLVLYSLNSGDCLTNSGGFILEISVFRSSLRHFVSFQFRSSGSTFCLLRFQCLLCFLTTRSFTLFLIIYIRVSRSAYFAIWSTYISTCMCACIWGFKCNLLTFYFIFSSNLLWM